MVYDPCYLFKASVSLDAYENKEISGAMIGSTRVEENREIRKKYGYSGNKGIGYKEDTYNPHELLDKMITGSVLCNLFYPETTRKDGTFGSSQKKDENFRGSYIVGVDIDHTSYKTAEEFIDQLEFKPTFYYTSYSNLQENKGARFRMIYVFDDIIVNPLFFRYVAWNVNKKIEQDTDEVIDDYCNVRCSQYFNGTNINTPGLIVSYGITNLIYSPSDFNIDREGYIDFLNNYCFYKTRTAQRTLDINEQLNLMEIVGSEEEEKEETGEEITVDKDLLNDMMRLDYDEFMKYNRHKYKYFWRAEKDWGEKEYQKVDEDYFSFTYSFGANSILHDGQKRRKKLFLRMCLRRVMNPEVDINTILFNAYEDIHRFFDFTGLDMESYLKRNVEACFLQTVDDIKEQFSETIEYLKEKTRPKRGIIYKNRKAHSKETSYKILDELYNPELTVNENLEMLEKLDFKIGKTLLYDYLKENGLKTNSGKLSDEEILGMIDFDSSANSNLKNLKNAGVKISKERLLKLYKLFK